MSLLTVKQTADRLKVSAALVYQLCASRRLRHERIGFGRGTIRIPEDAVEEFRQACRRDVLAGEPGPKPKGRTAKTFANLDSEKLLTAWKSQGAV